MSGPPPVGAPVLFPLPFDKPYDYLAGETDPPSPGAFVRAPLGPRERIGVVWRSDRPAGERAIDPSRLKPLVARLDAPALSADVMAFVEWVAAYTMFPLGSVLRLVMRGGDALRPVKAATGYLLGPGQDVDAVATTPGRRAVVAAAAAAGAPATARALAQAAGVGEGVVRGLVAAGALESVAIDPDVPFAPPDLDAPGRALSADQEQAAARAAALVDETKPKPLLIDGVTGSGKTEVYLEAVAAALRADPQAQALILLPEIALTLPFLERVAERFRAAPAAWHADVKPAERRRVWKRVADGSARIVVGARSALFLPFRNLRLIVVDEEHESAYKQEDGVVYHGRDMAVARAALGRFPVLLASATPSLETVVNVEAGRYDFVRLSSRFGPAQLPAVNLVDLRRTPAEPGAWLAPELVNAVDRRLARREQSLLFINRRGYAPLTICRRCGHRMKAPDSDTWLVEHRFENRLVCHHTGFSMPKPAACPNCGAVGGLAACGPGVERLAEEVARRWPDARSAVLSSDTAQTPAALQETLARMKAGDVDILVATQVVAKGHTFPGLTLVGVVDADMGLAGGDLRAAERPFQLISQVTGRAGRADKPGAALLQTYQPDAPVLRALAAGDRDSFLEAEAEGRRRLGFPPYGRLAAVILRSADETALKAAADAHRAALAPARDVAVWGPAPAPIYRLRGEARIRFLVKAARDVRVQGFLEDWLARVKLRGPVRRTVDIDPYSFL
ncbi:MAG: primosomal protein N' [Pseudomonadota bacterium]